MRQAAIAHYGIAPGVPFRVLGVACGLPRSGKSTWAMQQHVPMVDPDSVRLAFQGRPYIRETEEWIWSITRLMVRSLFFAGHQDVIVQGVNATTEHRKQWTANDLWFPVFCVFQTPADVCIARAKKNVRNDLISVIPHIARSWAMPTQDEGPVLIIT